jgi:hypothetical protein
MLLGRKSKLVSWRQYTKVHWPYLIEHRDGCVGWDVVQVRDFAREMDLDQVRQEQVIIVSCPGVQLSVGLCELCCWERFVH